MLYRDVRNFTVNLLRRLCTQELHKKWQPSIKTARSQIFCSCLLILAHIFASNSKILQPFQLTRNKSKMSRFVAAQKNMHEKADKILCRDCTILNGLIGKNKIIRQQFVGLFLQKAFNSIQNLRMKTLCNTN